MAELHNFTSNYFNYSNNYNLENDEQMQLNIPNSIQLINGKNDDFPLDINVTNTPIKIVGKKDDLFGPDYNASIVKPKAFENP